MNIPQPLLAVGAREPVAEFLAARHLLEPGESVVAVARAGEGNMNCTLRVRTDRRSMIVKQSRPWVEKYPQFPAPAERNHREAEFYAWARQWPLLRPCLPALLFADRPACVLVMEDLGADADYTDLYRGTGLEPAVAGALAEFLTELHGRSHGQAAVAAITNRAMRDLNADHIFRIPFQEANGLDLDRVRPGLRALAAPLKRDAALVGAVERLGREAYLADGPCLVHGDFFPGSILRAARGPCVIDFEFCYAGRPEFDPGVFVGHLALARQTCASIEAFLDAYRPLCGFDPRLVLQFAGVEMLRRLIGYAQLPLTLDAAGCAALLERGRALVLEPRRELLWGG